MTKAYQDQVAVVTGASSGIGRALAKALAAEGAKVGLVARRRDLLESLAGEITHAGGTAALAVADVADRSATVGAIQEVRARLGPVDLLVANAGLGGPTLIEPFNVEHVEQMIRVNYLGVVYSIEAVLPEMLRRGRGHLAAVSSLGSYKGLAGAAGYGASKAAVNNFMEALRLQLRRKGVAVTTICPGFIRTPMTDQNQFAMPWMMEADEAARRIVRALRNKTKVHNFPRRMTLITKLSTWLPDWLVVRYLPEDPAKAWRPADSGTTPTPS